MIRLIITIGIALVCMSASAADRITAAITITNRALTSNSFTVNGSIRTWTNSDSATTIETNLTSINASKTNLFNHIAAHPFGGGVSMLNVGISNFSLIGAFGGALAVNVTGTWATVTLSTQSGPTTFPMLYPISAVTGTTNQTNQSSDVVNQLSSYATNSITTNAVSLSNYITKGASPLQRLRAPVQFEGTLISASNLLATNGYTVALTNINSVSTGHVNYGSSLRSEGPDGGQQVGSNAIALGASSIAFGNNTFASNGAAPNVGAMALGNGAVATNSLAAAIGNNSVAAGLSSLAIGEGASALGLRSLALGQSSLSSTSDAVSIGTSAQATKRFTVALGNGSVAGETADFGIAIGYAAKATNSGAIAIGATAVSSNASTIVLGTTSYRTHIPGFLEVNGGISNATTTANSTNVLRGSWSYPRFDLTTLANGNNISIPLGTNRFVRLAGTVTASPTLCGFIGAATSGGNDGQEVIIHNELGFAATFAQNTVDPVPANRIETTDGNDVSIVNNGWALIEYSGADSRWHIAATYPVTATATNGIYSIWTNGVAVSSAATNINFIHGPGAVQTTNAGGAVNVELNQSYRIFVLTNNVTVTNTTSPTSLITNAGLGTQIIPGNVLKPGSVIRVIGYGYMSSVSANITEVGLRANNSLVLATNLQALATTLVNDQMIYECDITIRSVGVSGSAMAVGSFTRPTSALGSESKLHLKNGLVPTAVTVDTTAGILIDPYVDPGATTHGFTMANLVIEIIP